MKMKSKIAIFTACTVLMSSSLSFSYADSIEGEVANGNVVTIGADLTPMQKQKVFDYFGITQEDVKVIEVNNQDERKYLTGVATESQLGTKTYSCSYVQPTDTGNGLNVKTSNFTFLNSSMLVSSLITLGVQNANVLAMSPLEQPISGTGALAGVMKAFEEAYGEELDETKKELASEELVVTGNLGKDIGQEKAAGLVNEIKTEIIKNGTNDTAQIAETINNISNVYNVNLSEEQVNKIISLMEKISKEDYDYKELKKSLKTVGNLIDKNLKALGDKVDRGFITNVLNNVKSFFSDLLDKKDSENLGIVGSTNDSVLGENAIIDATDKSAINLPSSEQVEGFLTKLWNWVTGLFSKDEKTVTDNKTEDVIEEKKEESIVTEDEIPSDNITGDTQINSNDTQEDLNVKAEDDIIADEIIEVDDNETQE